MQKEYTAKDILNFIKTANLDDINKLLKTIQDLLKGGYDECVMEVINAWFKVNDNEFDIDKLFFDLRLYENLSGTKYIKKIIKLSLEDDKLLDNSLITIMNIIDPEKLSTFSKMDRVIRDAIKKSWKDIDYELKNEIFPSVTEKAPSITVYINYVSIYCKTLYSHESEITKIKRLGKR